jgi:signal transduction histidine kinase
LLADAAADLFGWKMQSSSWATVGLSVGLAMGAMAAHGTAAKGSVAEPLHTIAAVVALPIDQYDVGRAACIVGTVTLVRQFTDRPTFFAIQDGDVGIFVDLRQYSSESPAIGSGMADIGFQVGSRVEVTGTVEPGTFAPKIMASAVRWLCPGTLPEPTPVDMARLFEGVDVARRIVLRGTCQSIMERASRESWAVSIRAQGHNVTAELPQWDFPGRPNWLIDAEVEVAGVVGSYRNSRGEMIAPNLTVASLGDVMVLTPAPESPFAAENLQLDVIARFRPTRRGGHRVCTDGVVLRAFSDRLFLFDGGAGVRVDLLPSDDATMWQPGDRVEVAGFVTRARGIAGLSGAVVRKTASGPPPQPVLVDPADIYTADQHLTQSDMMARPGNHDGSLIRCRGRLESVTTVNAPVLELSSAGRSFSASLPAGVAFARFVQGLKPGSELALTGVVEAEFRDQHEIRWPMEHFGVTRFNLALGGPGDVVVLRSPSWWTPRRLAVTAVSMAVIVGATAIWLAVLRREVRRQTSLAIAHAAARRQDAVEFEVSLRERTKLAADLHDTILQTIAGIGFQLRACEEAREYESAVKAGSRAADDCHLIAAKHMVENAVEQLRGTVWSLRTLPADGTMFSQALRDAIARLGEGHAARITAVIDANADELSPLLGGHLLQIVKECVHNALLHARPATIDVRVGIDTAADMVTASVSDDGVGFVVGQEAGPAEGHFGLTGLRERVAAIGGRVAIHSALRAGTTTVVTAPLVSHRTSLSPLGANAMNVAGSTTLRRL